MREGIPSITAAAVSLFRGVASLPGSSIDFVNDRGMRALMPRPMRAALGALGYWWLALAEPLLVRHLWLGPAAGVPARAVWEGSLSSTAVHVIGPLLSVGMLLGAALWAGGAVVLPLLVRGRNATVDVVAAVVWTATLAAATPSLDGGPVAHVAGATPRGLLLGAVLGAAVAIAARALRGPV